MGIKTIIDAGAYVGTWSKTAAAVFPQVEIYAFEPLPAPYEKLKERMAAVKHFHPFNIAVGNAEANTVFHLNEFPQAPSLLKTHRLGAAHFENISRSREIQTRMTTLDAILEPYDLKKNILIKIDVQGAERLVIEAGSKTFFKTAIAILELSFETLYEGSPLFDELHEEMHSRGFRYHGTLYGFQLDSPVDGRPMQADCIYIKE